MKDVAYGEFRRCAQNLEKASRLEKTVFQAVFQKTNSAKPNKARDTWFQKNNDNPKNRKERGKRGTISKRAHREGQSELC